MLLLHSSNAFGTVDILTDKPIMAQCSKWTVRLMEADMNVISKLLDSIDNYLARQENRQMEAFLSQAQNLGELEYRLRLLDSRSNHSLF